MTDPNTIALEDRLGSRISFVVENGAMVKASWHSSMPVPNSKGRQHIVKSFFWYPGVTDQAIAAGPYNHDVVLYTTGQAALEVERRDANDPWLNPLEGGLVQVARDGLNLQDRLGEQGVTLPPALSGLANISYVHDVLRRANLVVNNAGELENIDPATGMPMGTGMVTQQRLADGAVGMTRPVERTLVRPDLLQGKKAGDWLVVEKGTLDNHYFEGIEMQVIQAAQPAVLSFFRRRVIYPAQPAVLEPMAIFTDMSISEYPGKMSFSRTQMEAGLEAAKTPNARGELAWNAPKNIAMFTYGLKAFDKLCQPAPLPAFTPSRPVAELPAPKTCDA